MSRTRRRGPDVEKLLTEIWKKVLRLNRVDTGDNFFDLGGNSKLSINVVFEAKQAGLMLDLSQLYQHQTIAELARVVGETKPAAAADPRVLVAAQPSETEPAFLVTIDSLRAFGREALLRAGLSSRWRRDRDRGPARSKPSRPADPRHGQHPAVRDEDRSRQDQWKAVYSDRIRDGEYRANRWRQWSGPVGEHGRYGRRNAQGARRKALASSASVGPTTLVPLGIMYGRQPSRVLSEFAPPTDR